MWDEKLVRFKNEAMEILLTIKQMLANPVMMVLHCLWIVITFQDEDYARKVKQTAEEDRMKKNHQMPNEFLQGNALVVRISISTIEPIKVRLLL